MKIEHKILASFIVVIILLVTGCWYIIFQPNFRMYIKDNVEFIGYIDFREGSFLRSKRDTKYHILEIGSEYEPFYNSNTNFNFKFDSNNAFNSKSINIEKLKALCKWTEKANRYGDGWPDGSEEIWSDTYSFIINDDKVLYFRAREAINTENQPEISKRGSDNFYKFPLTEDQVIEVFGKQDRFRNFFQH